MVENNGEPALHMPQLNNNQHAALAGKEDNADNDTESIGVENDGEITGMQHNEKTTGVDSDKESTESGGAGATEKADEMALIEETIAEAEQDIAEETDLLAGTKTETENTWNENLIHPDLQVPTVEHTYNLWRRRNPQLDYTNRYGFQATIIHCALTQLPMKRGLNKFKKKCEKAVTAELEQLHRRDTFRPVRTDNPIEKQKHRLLALLMFLK